MFRSLGTLLKWAVLLPILAAIVLLAVANGHSVTVHLNPFDSGDPVLKIDLPLYQLGFGIFVLGVLIGGLIVWVGQAKYRRRARERHDDAALWQAQAERSGARESNVAPYEGSRFLPRPERS